MIAELLMNEINVPDDDCAVLLSGGVDSISIGFAAERLGKKVHAYSFCLDTHLSYDFQKAKEVAEVFNWPFTGIEVPTKNLTRYSRYCIIVYERVRKGFSLNNLNEIKYGNDI